MIDEKEELIEEEQPQEDNSESNSLDEFEENQESNESNDFDEEAPEEAARAIAPASAAELLWFWLACK